MKRLRLTHYRVDLKDIKLDSISSYKSPHLLYKTKYDTPGEVLFNPPFGSSNGDNLTRSAGDNPRRVYLGVSNTVGIDVDFTSYKGKQNPTNLGNRN